MADRRRWRWGARTVGWVALATLVVFVVRLHPGRSPVQPAGHQPVAVVPVSHELGSEVAGNARPVVVRYAGQLVRRCLAVALYARSPGDAAGLRNALRARADTFGLRLTDVSADVLSPAVLQRPAPEVVACLPSGTAGSVADRLLAKPLPGTVEHRSESVLVHALTFSIRPAHGDAGELLAAVNREGILSDLLGDYQASATGTHGSLVISYTGPLLSDTEVDTAREAIGRPAGAAGIEVGVRPLNPGGPAIDLATEPPPAPALEPTAPAHHH